MKVRNGFVSNSSSSSFCIYGAYIDESDYERFGKPKDCEAWKWFGEKLLGYNLVCCGGYDYGAYVGRSLKTIGDDETGAQFKKSVKEEVGKLFEPMSCDFEEGEEYN